MTEIAPIRRYVSVPVSAESAFALFTSHIGAWWPTHRHSVFGEGSLVAFEGDRLVERSSDGMSVWAEVVEWDPPRTLRLAWHAGQDATHATDVRVSFSSEDGLTLVTLEHGGWERHEHPAEAAEEYGNGWPTVLAGFADRVASVTEADGSPDGVAEGKGEGVGEVDVVPAAEKEAQWYALVHTPGPLMEAEGGSLFAHPMFGEHVAFLMRLHERGFLVAAGPVFPERGEGMTVIKVEPGHTDIDIVELATLDDLAVVGGLLQVDVRPWDVRFSA
jgi:uncharacterized protein YciI